MKLRSAIFYIFLVSVIVTLIVAQAIIEEKVKEQILAFFVSLFGLVIFEIIKRHIFLRLIDSKQAIIHERIKILSMLGKIIDYDDFLINREKIVKNNNAKYFNELKRFFYSVYKFDISDVSDIKTLLSNKKQIQKEILKGMIGNKEKAYRSLQKNFRTIHRDRDYDSGFSKLYFDYLNRSLFMKENDSTLSLFLSIISLFGFALTFAITILKADPIEFVKYFAIYSVAMSVFQSFMGVIDYSSAYSDEQYKLNQISTSLNFLGENLDEPS